MASGGSSQGTGRESPCWGASPLGASPLVECLGASPSVGAFPSGASPPPEEASHGVAKHLAPGTWQAQTSRPVGTRPLSMSYKMYWRETMSKHSRVSNVEWNLSRKCPQTLHCLRLGTDTLRDAKQAEATFSRSDKGDLIDLRSVDLLR